MTHVYPRARPCRPALLDRVELRKTNTPRTGGTLVAVGTHIDQFDRLLRLADSAAQTGVLPSPVVGQTGSCTYVPRHFAARAWMRPEEMGEIIDNSRAVLCHAGSGLIARALDAGITPLILPRLARFGEHVDDHQAQITQKLAELGVVVPVRSGVIGAADLRRAGEPVSHDALAALGAYPTMHEVLGQEIARILNW